MAENVPSPPGRCEVTVLSNGATAIVDYAHNCNSFRNILNSGDVLLICGRNHEQYQYMNQDKTCPVLYVRDGGRPKKH